MVESLRGNWAGRKVDRRSRGGGGIGNVLGVMNRNGWI